MLIDRNHEAAHDLRYPHTYRSAWLWTTKEYQAKLTAWDPVILASARKHGVTDNDMLHAYRNPIRIFDLDDLVALVGADETGSPLEVGVATAEGVEFIVHAMPARPKFSR